MRKLQIILSLITVFTINAFSDIEPGLYPTDSVVVEGVIILDTTGAWDKGVYSPGLTINQVPKSLNTTEEMERYKQPVVEIMINESIDTISLEYKDNDSIKKLNLSPVKKTDDSLIAGDTTGYDTCDMFTYETCNPCYIFTGSDSTLKFYLTTEFLGDSGDSFIEQCWYSFIDNFVATYAENTPMGYVDSSSHNLHYASKKTSPVRNSKYKQKKRDFIKISGHEIRLPNSYAKLKIYTLRGRCVYSTKVYSDKSNQIRFPEINTKGIFIVRTSSKNSSVSQKILFE